MTEESESDRFKIRNYKPEDAAAIDEIYKRCHGHFNLPHLDKCVGLAVIEHEGKIIAFGALEMILESVLVLDTDLPKRIQTAALVELFRVAMFKAGLEGFNEFYAFPDSNSYSEILKKHFGFKDGNPILIKRLDNGE